MECPKCGGGSYLAEEELVQVLNQTDPVKILLRAIYQCRACQEKFSRLVYDHLENRQKQQEPRGFYNHTQQQQTQPQAYDRADSDPAEGLRFF